MYWNKSCECMSRERLEELQFERLRSMVEMIYHEVPFYRNKLQERDFFLEDIKSLDDLQKLPFTTKVVPMVVFHSPGFTAPEATCEAHPSVIPVTTCKFFDKPNCSANEDEIFPIGVPEGNTFGSHSFFKESCSYK